MKIDKSPAKDALSRDDIREMASAFQRSRILLTAYELDLFTVLGEESKSSIEVAKALGTEKRATERLINALCAIGLLKKNEGMFLNTSLSLRFLVKGKPEFMSGLMHIVNLWDTWSTLTKAVRHGKSVLAQHVDKRNEEWRSAFIDAMHERACNQAQGVVELIDLNGVSRVLDVGGGSGAYSMAFVKAMEGIKATVFDLPNIVPLTQNYIKKENLSNKVETVVGDYNVNELGSGYDLVFLSAIIHSNSFEENLNLLRKCSMALNTRGQVIVQDFIMDKDKTSPAFGAIFSLNMLVGTESGDTYTESEVKMWMEESGLSNIIRKDTDFGTTLIIGRKVKE